jgi:hypothetical protein
MPGLTGAWRAICHSITSRRQAAVTIDPSACSINTVHWYSKLLAITRTVGNRLQSYFRSAGQRVQQAQANRALPWLEIIRNERRAKRRALILLLGLLNPEQRQEFRDFRYFHVTGAGSRERYRIRVDMIANIDVLGDDGKVKYRLCVHPTGGVPVYDVMAAQLLHLQDAVTEKRLLQQANALPALPERSVCSRPAWNA